MQCRRKFRSAPVRSRTWRRKSRIWKFWKVIWTEQGESKVLYRSSYTQHSHSSFKLHWTTYEHIHMQYNDKVSAVPIGFDASLTGLILTRLGLQTWYIQVHCSSSVQFLYWYHVRLHETHDQVASMRWTHEGYAWPSGMPEAFQEKSNCYNGLLQMKRSLSTHQI